MTETPISERKRITFIGRRNAGKSSLINAITDQNVSIVSEIAGTTTDPVSKTMELFPLGPVVITDTAGLDDTGELGRQRVERSYEILKKTDIIILAIPSDYTGLDLEKELIGRFSAKPSKLIVCMTKSDINGERLRELSESLGAEVFAVSAVTGSGIEALRKKLGSISLSEASPRSILDGVCHTGSRILLVTPIDESAPKGRMILPQVMALRDSMDKHCICSFVQPEEFSACYDIMRPDLVITDSQAFETVKSLVPEDQKLTSFSILTARAKGDLLLFYEGARNIKNLRDGSRILIAEACTHHVQKKDIGTQLIPDKLKRYTGKELIFEKTTGAHFPSDLSGISLVVHCGGCMINAADMRARQQCAQISGVPMTNYGILLAEMAGILDRAAKWLL